MSKTRGIIKGDGGGESSGGTVEIKGNVENKKKCSDAKHLARTRRDSWRWKLSKQEQPLREQTILRHYRVLEESPEECAICGSTCNLVWDHDSETGLPRGRICQSCNVAIGFLKHDPERAKKAAEYLSAYEELCRETLDAERRPEEKASHFHPCPSCRDAVECFCEFPDLDFSDEFAECVDCRNKSLQTR